jgi:hypothetical protein
LRQKTTERNRVVVLYRRGRPSNAGLDTQIDEIGKEETALEAQIGKLRGRMAGVDSVAANVALAQDLLAHSRNGMTSWSHGRLSGGSSKCS